MNVSDRNTTPDQDHQYHTYTTHRIPWGVRAIWIGFWIFTIAYFIINLVPSAKHYF